ncbi:MAG: FAD-dependent oxidoreductase [Paracoccaceae bacterium]|jgi:3-phenylpropionate/trans-cinnamate dioxygenase ferredoxin reductase subunit
MAGIIVIGAGQAGSSLVAKLRALGFGGPITLIGAEPVPPYQRPPLSKKYMLGEMDVERLFLRPEVFYADQNISLRLGIQVNAIDRTAKTVTLDNDEVLAYDQLALTTGSDPIQLPPSIGGNLKGVYTVRTLADADAMAADFVKGKRALIVGGGYIGLEAAAVAVTRGVHVILVEMAERILQRVAAPETSDYFRTLHTTRGVDLREGVGLASLNGDDGQVSSATLSDGTELKIDFAVVGVGIRPSTSLAENIGLTIENGIKVDGLGRTSDPAIFAAGDCASFPHQSARIRLESVPNAIEQAEATAAAMLGAEVEYRAKPWFWSDQYDVKLQIAGLNTGYDRVISRISDKAASFWYFNGTELLAVDAMNDPRAYMVGKRLIEAGRSPDPAAVQDTDTDLKMLL